VARNTRKFLETGIRRPTTEWTKRQPMTGEVRRSRTAIIHPLEGPAHVFRTCIASLYASPSLASHTEPSEVSHMIDAASNEKCRYAQDCHSIDHRSLAESTTPTSFFVKRSIFEGLREVAPRDAGNQAAHNSPGGLNFETRRVVVLPMVASSGPATCQVHLCVALDERGKITTP